MDGNVYLGVWTNWSRGPIFGPTLTTTTSNGSLIIAFAASFVAFVASRLWKILGLVLHRYYSTTEPRDSIHHQRQVVLRNSSDPEMALFESLALLWAWRKLRFRRIASLVLLVIFITCYVVGFLAAGGFSSRISTAIGDEVLIRSAYCGPLVSNETAESSVTMSQFNAERLNSAANYAQDCYSSNSSSTSACTKFVVSNLPTAVANNTAECPFQHQICRRPQSTLHLDSGYIDGNSDLGLNAPENERFALRYVLQCTPLQTDGYISHIEEDGRGWDRYHYANKTPGPSDSPLQMQDWLFEIDDIDSQYPAKKNMSNVSGFNVKLR